MRSHAVKLSNFPQIIIVLKGTFLYKSSIVVRFCIVVSLLCVLVDQTVNIVLRFIRNEVTDDFFPSLFFIFYFQSIFSKDMFKGYVQSICSKHMFKVYLNCIYIYIYNLYIYFTYISVFRLTDRHTDRHTDR